MARFLIFLLKSMSFFGLFPLTSLPFLYSFLSVFFYLILSFFLSSIQLFLSFFYLVLFFFIHFSLISQMYATLVMTLLEEVFFFFDIFMLFRNEVVSTKYYSVFFYVGVYFPQVLYITQGANSSYPYPYSFDSNTWVPSALIQWSSDIVTGRV